MIKKEPSHDEQCFCQIDSSIIKLFKIAGDLNEIDQTFSVECDLFKEAAHQSY